MNSDIDLVLERAAIMEFDGGLSQAVAEQEAEWLLFGPPDPLVEQWLADPWH